MARLGFLNCHEEVQALADPVPAGRRWNYGHPVSLPEVSRRLCVLSLDETIARYIERKADIEKVRRFRLLHSSLASSLPLPAASVDLAILGSCPELETDNWKLVTDELIRVAANVLLVENSPLSPPLAEAPLIDAGFRLDAVAVPGLGLRRCWWRLSRT